MGLQGCDGAVGVATLKAGDDGEMLVYRLEQRGTEAGPAVDDLGHADIVLQALMRVENGPVVEGLDDLPVHAVVECEEAQLGLFEGAAFGQAVAALFVALANVGEPLVADRVAEAAQGGHFDHDAKLVVLADKLDLRIDDPDARTRLDLDETELPDSATAANYLLNVTLSNESGGAVYHVVQLSGVKVGGPEAVATATMW